MKHKIIYILTTIFLITSCANREQITVDFKTVPLPRSIEYTKGEAFFNLTKSTSIVYEEGNERMQIVAELLSQYLKQNTGIELQISTDNKKENAIILQNTLKHDNTEAYELTVSKTNIIINGASEAGIFYGVQTLRKAIFQPQIGEARHQPVVSKVEIPLCTILDFPQFKHRGAMLDVSRHFFDVQFVKKYIDVLALFNMNVFHWHLTDDQGWRIEIKKHPKLTEIGSKRTETAIDRHSEEYDGTPYGGYYTQEEIKEVVKYAQDRFITIIPEIDIPGHTLAVLTSYPNLGCTGGPYQVGRGWGIYEDVLCAGNDEVFNFLDDVFSEIATLFPSAYIHIGGDECVKNRWMACPKCKKRIKEEGIKADAQHSEGELLQSYFIKRVDKIIAKNGKKLIGWDEILEGGIAPNATIMSWRGTEGGQIAAGNGHDVIMTSEAYVYLDYYQSDSADEPYTFGWLTPLKKVYSFDPIPKDLAKDKQQHILGAQVNVWVEYIKTGADVEYMLLPRMAALAETLWSYPTEKNYKEFVSRMYKQSFLLDYLDYKNSKASYNIEAEYEYDTENKRVQISLFNFKDAPMHYSLNNTDVISYDAPIIAPVDSLHILRATSVPQKDYPEQQFERIFSINKATVCPITLKYAPDAKYTFKGAITLVDGQAGNPVSYRTGSWIGFSGTDMEATIKLKPQTEISSFDINVFVNTRGNLFDAKSIEIEVSDDGKIFSSLAKETYPITAEHIKPQVVKHSLEFTKTKTNYIRIKMEAYKILPDWHEKVGGNSLLMIDEIVVK